MHPVFFVTLKHNLPILAILLFSAFSGGCSSGTAKTAAVTGHVTYKGKPVPKANVSFTPIEGESRAATGVTDANGYFALGTFAISDGAPVGKYRVSIIARGPDRKPKPGETGGSGMPGELLPGDPVIPTKYFAPDSSGLTFEVKRDSNRADFDLKD